MSEREEHARRALAMIEVLAKWYADNPYRLPLEVDFALCVQVLDLAQRGLDGGDLVVAVNDP